MTFFDAFSYVGDGVIWRRLCEGGWMQAQPSRKPSTVQPIETPRQPSSMYCHHPARVYCQEPRDAEQELSPKGSGSHSGPNRNENARTVDPLVARCAFLLDDCCVGD